MDNQNTAPKTVVDELYYKFGQATFTLQDSKDEVPTLWVPKNKINDVQDY